MRGGADSLVTFNLKDFPAESTEGHHIEVVHPDTFLQRLLTERPSDVVAALERATSTFRRPPASLREFLASLTATVPTFANLAADAVAHPPGSGSPVAALVVADEREALAAFGEPGDLTDPGQVAFLWWAGLLEHHELARNLTFDPAAWGDYEWARDMLASRSLASKVIPAIDAPGEIAFMRFLPEVATTSQAFADHLSTTTILVLVRLQDETWRVWGLGGSMPAGKDIRG